MNVMNKESKISIKKPDITFCITCIVSLCVLLALLFVSHGELFDNYFFYDTSDTFMDFFHSIEYVQTRAPYDDFGTLYPPLANLLFYGFYLLCPKSVTDTWTSTFSRSVLVRRTWRDLRIQQVPLMIFVFFLIVSILMLYMIINHVLESKKTCVRNMIALCSCTGYGMLYCIERGNILLLVVVLCLFFVFYKDSENKYIKELALLSLAIAAGLKIYPAFFGVLLIKDKQYKEAFRTVVYGIMLFILPFFFFKEGIAGLKIFISKLVKFSAPSNIPWASSSFGGIVARIVHYVEMLFRTSITIPGLSYIGLIFSLLLLCLAMFSKDKWVSNVLIVLAIMTYSSQAEYIYALFIIPVIRSVCDCNRLDGERCILFLCVVLLFAPLPLPYIRNVSYVNYAIRQLFLIIAYVFSIAITIKDVKTK